MKKGFLCVWLNLCARMSGWNHLKGLTLSYLWLIMKVGSALPSLWRSHTTPKWRTTTKPSNSCWKRTTRGQSSSLPTKRTYGEAHRSFWLHACSADGLMTCYVKVFHLWGAALEEKLEAQIYCEPRLCLLHKQTYNNTNTRFSEDWECRWQKKQGKYCFPHTHTSSVCNVYKNKCRIKDFSNLKAEWGTNDVQVKSRASMKKHEIHGDVCSLSVNRNICVSDKAQKELMRGWDMQTALQWWLFLCNSYRIAHPAWSLHK